MTLEMERTRKGIRRSQKRVVVKTEGAQCFRGKDEQMQQGVGRRLSPDDMRKGFLLTVVGTELI